MRMKNISFRAPIELAEWLQRLAKATPDRPELTYSQAALWVMQLGREWLEVQTSEVRDVINAKARERGITRVQAMVELLKAPSTPDGSRVPDAISDSEGILPSPDGVAPKLESAEVGIPSEPVER